MYGSDGFTVSKSKGEIEGRHDELLNEAQLAAVAEEKEAHSFEIDPAQVTWGDSLKLNKYWLYIVHITPFFGSNFKFLILFFFFNLC